MLCWCCGTRDDPLLTSPNMQEKAHRHVRDTRASFNVIRGASHAGNRSACEEFAMRPTRASSFGEAVIIGTEVYNTLKCPRCTRVCAKPKEHAHVSSRGRLRTLPGQCPLFFQFSGAFVNVWKLFCARRLDSLDSLHASVSERPMRQVTCR